MQPFLTRKEEEANLAVWEADRPAREAEEQAKDALMIAASVLQPAVDQALAKFNKATWAGKQMWEAKSFLAKAEKLSAKDAEGHTLADQAHELLYPKHGAPRNTEAVIALTVRMLAATVAYNRVAASAAKATKRGYPTNL